MLDRLYDWWWRFGMTVVFISVIVLVIGLVAVGSYWEVKEEKRLKERYISLCVKDQLKENPYMERAEALERCEVAYEMAEANRPKSDTTIIWVPTN